MEKETIEEVAERLYPKTKNQVVDFANELRKEGFLKCAKWQQERMYSNEEVLKFSDWIVFEVERYGCPTNENIIKALKEIKRILRQ